MTPFYNILDLPLDVKLRKRNNPPGAVPPRRGECKGRLGVLGDEGPLRLDVEPSNLPKSTRAILRSGDRPVRI